MALQRDARYPGRWTAASSGHPQGAFKNRSAPGALDGSYIEQDWANDWDAFFSSLLNAASITPNGNVDAVGSSQYFAALQALYASGRILNIQPFTTTATYTKTPGATKCIILGSGAGGAGGGAVATTASQTSAGGGGNAGSHGIAFIGISTITTFPVTIGVGGVTNVGGNGFAGGTTSFGALVTFPGGNGGIAGAAQTSFPQNNGAPGSVGSSPTGANILSSTGNLGDAGFLLQLSSARGGNGGISNYGPAFGAGGPGNSNSASQAAKGGTAGQNGFLVIVELA